MIVVRIRCDNIFNSARTLPSLWWVCIQMAIIEIGIISETQDLKILFYLYYFVFLLII